MTFVRVLPDVPAINREFDYSVPERWSDAVQVGSMVRIPLHGRRVAGWVTAVDVEPPSGVRVVPLAKISGIGPDAAMIDLCRWAAWRWAGRAATFLGTASPLQMVGRLPQPPRREPGPEPEVGAIEWLARPRTVLRLPPAEDTLPFVLAGWSRGDTLVVCPSIGSATGLARRLRSERIPVAMYPDEWSRAAAGGCVVVGARAAAFAPMPALASVVVIDEQDEALQNEGSPTWHAREVALERARRAQVPALMTSPCPSLESVRRSPLVVESRSEERAGWPVTRVIDRRDEDRGRSGLYSEQLVRALRVDATVVCVLNRAGRAQLLACSTCRELTRCETCGAAVHQERPGELSCRRCGAVRPVICQACGATRLKNLRQGITRAREELEALLREPVVELSGATRRADVPRARVYVGTEAVLHQVSGAAVVAFLEFDQELLAPRYRAAEQALGLLARAARLVGGRGDGGLLVIQTRLPEHEVIRAAVHADPAIVMDAERQRRELTRFPPAVTMAFVGGEAAPEYILRFGAPIGVDVLERDGSWLLVADERRTLLDALAATERPSGRLRLQIDPMRLS